MIETLKFIAHSSGSESPFVDLGEENWIMHSEPEDVFISNITIDILGVVEESKNIDFDEPYITKKIGEISGVYFNTEFATNSSQEIYDLFDSYSQDAVELCTYLFSEDEVPNQDVFELNYNVFDLEYIYIEEEYRKKGIGTFVLKQLDNIMQATLNHSAGCFVCIPLPTAITNNDDMRHISYDTSDKKLISSLRNIMRNCGYRSIKGSQYLYKNNERRTKELKIIWPQNDEQ